MGVAPAHSIERRHGSLDSRPKVAFLGHGFTRIHTERKTAFALHSSGCSSSLRLLFSAFRSSSLQNVILAPSCSCLGVLLMFVIRPALDWPISGRRGSQNLHSRPKVAFLGHGFTRIGRLLLLFTRPGARR